MRRKLLLGWKELQSGDLRVDSGNWAWSQVTITKEVGTPARQPQGTEFSNNLNAWREAPVKNSVGLMTGFQPRENPSRAPRWAHPDSDPQNWELVSGWCSRLFLVSVMQLWKLTQSHRQKFYSSSKTRFIKLCVCVCVCVCGGIFNIRRS